MAITPAESLIMGELWERGPLSAEEIVAAVAQPQGWGVATVRTLIQRLLKRGAVRSDKADGCTRYAPVLTRAEYLTAESQHLLDRLFDGRLAPMVAHCAEGKALTPAKIARLKALLAQIDEDAG